MTLTPFVLSVVSYIISHVYILPNRMELQRESIDIQSNALFHSSLNLVFPCHIGHMHQLQLLILNKRPTPLLKMHSPWEILHHDKPALSYLKAFGCKCFPLLNPYNTHKLQPKTAPAYFRISTYYKGYICQDTTTKRLYISRHVLFNETKFLALQPSTLTAQLDSSCFSHSPNTWLTHFLSTHSCNSLSCNSCLETTGPNTASLLIPTSINSPVQPSAPILPVSNLLLI